MTFLTKVAFAVLSATVTSAVNVSWVLLWILATVLKIPVPPSVSKDKISPGFNWDVNIVPVPVTTRPVTESSAILIVPNNLSVYKVGI